MRALILAMVLLCATPARADRRLTGKILFGVGVGMVVVTAALGVLGSWGNSGDCARRSSGDACSAMRLAGDAGGGIAGPLSLALMVAGGVVYDRSGEITSLVRVRF